MSEDALERRLEPKESTAPEPQDREPTSFRWRDYASAQAWARSQGITGWKQWVEIAKTPARPPDIPFDPRLVYKEWRSWPAFLGTEMISFEQARAVARAHGVRDHHDWCELYASKKVLGLPSSPTAYYRDEWKGWHDFTGFKRRGATSTVERVLAAELACFIEIDANHKGIEIENVAGKQVLKRVDIISEKRRLLIEYDGVHFHRNLVDRDTRQTLALEALGWTVVRVREEGLPPISRHNVFVRPQAGRLSLTHEVLKHLVSIGLIHGADVDRVNEYGKRTSLLSAESEEVSVDRGGTLSFDEARAWARAFAAANGVKTFADFKALIHDPKTRLPPGIVTNPDRVYVHSWQGWNDFLDVGPVYWPYEKAKKWALSQNCGSVKEFHSRRPAEIHSRPERFYREWEGWEAFAGIKVQSVARVRRVRREYVSFEEARDFARKLGLKTRSDWSAFSSSGKRPASVPSNPEAVYLGQWSHWGDFLGSGSSPRRRSSGSDVRRLRARFDDSPLDLEPITPSESESLAASIRAMIYGPNQSLSAAEETGALAVGATRPRMRP